MEHEWELSKQQCPESPESAYLNTNAPAQSKIIFLKRENIKKNNSESINSQLNRLSADSVFSLMSIQYASPFRNKFITSREIAAVKPEKQFKVDWKLIVRNDSFTWLTQLLRVKFSILEKFEEIFLHVTEDFNFYLLFFSHSNLIPRRRLLHFLYDVLRATEIFRNLI